MKKKLKKIFQSTIVRLTSLALILIFLLSLFLFFDFYKRQYNKIKGYYWIHQGDIAFKKADLQRAINCYEHGIKLHPAHYRAMYNLANIYVVYEDYYSALKNYEKALLVNPRYEIARIDYAIILSENYKTDEAIEEYKKVVENKPIFIKIPLLVDNKKSYTHNLGVAYYNMGVAYRSKSLLPGLSSQTKKHYLEEAQNSYEQAADILKSYNANYNLGLVNHLLKNNHQAGYYYCKAMEISPMEYEAHYNLGVLLNDMKKAGLLLDTKGDGAKTRRIYDILTQVNQKIAIKDENSLKNYKENDNFKTKSKYKGGRLIIDENSKRAEKEMINSFKTCSGYEMFKGAK